MGNSHVVCTEVVANSFANGMEFFNTFGGNPVSCAIGTAVLQTVKKEKLQENALEVGTFLKEQLLNLAKDFPIIGDVRGQGFFLGIELVDAQKKPLPKQTDYLINRMKAHGILMGSDGLDHNVLKIKLTSAETVVSAMPALLMFNKNTKLMSGILNFLINLVIRPPVKVKTYNFINFNFCIIKNYAQ